MKIGIVFPHDWVKDIPVGGSSRVIKNILPYLAGEVYLLGLKVGKTEIAGPEKIGSNSCFFPLFRVSHPSRIPLRLKAFFLYWFSKKKIHQLGCDLLYFHSPESAVPFLLGKRNVPVVFHQHGSFNPVGKTRFFWARNRFFKESFNLILRIIYSRAKAIIAIDKLCYAQSEVNGGAGKTYLITNPVDNERFKRDDRLRTETRTRYGFSDGDKVLVFAGRLSGIKQIHLAVDAVGFEKNKGRKWNLLIVGEGETERSLRQQVARLGIVDQVFFLGPVSYENMPAIYNMADVVILPSLAEGVPMVLIESLACGTPVIATQVGGIPEIVKHKHNGILMSEGTAECLVIAIEECFQREWDRDQIIKSVGPWTAERIAKQIKEVLFKASERS